MSIIPFLSALPHSQSLRCGTYAKKVQEHLCEWHQVMRDECRGTFKYWSGLHWWALYRFRHSWMLSLTSMKLVLRCIFKIRHCPTPYVHLTSTSSHKCFRSFASVYYTEHKLRNKAIFLSSLSLLPLFLSLSYPVGCSGIVHETTPLLCLAVNTIRFVIFAYVNTLNACV